MLLPICIVDLIVGYIPTCTGCGIQTFIKCEANSTHNVCEKCVQYCCICDIAYCCIYEYDIVGYDNVCRECYRDYLE
jgi:hypothetical protein